MSNEWDKPENIEHLLKAAAGLTTAATGFTTAISILKKTFRKKATKHEVEEVAKTVQGIVNALVKFMDSLGETIEPGGQFAELSLGFIRRVLKSEAELKRFADAVVSVENQNATAMKRMCDLVLSLDARVKALEAVRATPRRTRSRTVTKAKKK